MARSGVTALSLAVVLALLELGSCLRCYQCSSLSDSTCASSPSKSSIVDCAGEGAKQFSKEHLAAVLPADTSKLGTDKFCHKVVTNLGIVTRTCLESKADNLDLSCTMIKDVGKEQIKFCSVCDKDECNAAGSIESSLPLAGVALLVTYLYSKQ